MSIIQPLLELTVFIECKQQGTEVVNCAVFTEIKWFLAKHQCYKSQFQSGKFRSVFKEVLYESSVELFCL